MLRTVICIALLGCVGPLSAADKLFDFGTLNVDLSKIQAKPETSATPPKQAPDQQLDSTPESPAPQVLPKDAEVDIDATVEREQLKVTPVKVAPTSAAARAGPYPVTEDRDVIEVKIAAGSEKRGWFEAAAERSWRTRR
jgi:hypothetical protein